MRRHLDQYFTPESATRSLLDRVKIKGNTFECCSGDGAIYNILNEGVDRTTLCNDIDSEMKAHFHRDAKDTFPNSFDWIVSNPPFSEAFPIVKNAVEHAQIGVAMLLRLSFLEPTYERGEWLSKQPPSLVLVLPRISFTGDGKTDSVTCAWMVWYNTSYWYNDMGEKIDQLKGIYIVPKKPRAVKSGMGMYAILNSSKKVAENTTE